MNQQSQGTSSLSSPDPPKRKRGRPRKDENLVQAESVTPMPLASDSLKKSKQSVGTSDDSESEMVGQVVTGVIEGSFDAGYLLNVRVGDTDTQLRGVVFLQERITPITPANDIAPHIKMCKRRDIPIPPVDLKAELHGSPHPSEQSARQPVEVKIQTPPVPEQTQSSIHQFPMESIGKKSFSILVNNLCAGSSLGGKVMPQQQFVEPGTDSQSAPAMAQPELNNVVEQDKVLVPVEAATIMEGPNGVEAIKATKSETSEPITDIPAVETLRKGPDFQSQVGDSEENARVDDKVKSLDLELNQTPAFADPAPDTVIPGVETVGKDAQIQTQYVDSEKSTLVHEDAKSLNLELNQNLVFAEPAPVGVIPGIETICKGSQIHPQELGTEKAELVHDVAKCLNIELNQTPVFAEPGFVSSNLTSKSVDCLMEEPAFSAPKPSEIFLGEIVPSESKLASEGSIPSAVVEPRISSPSGAISNGDCDVEDFIPPAQS